MAPNPKSPLALVRFADKLGIGLVFLAGAAYYFGSAQSTEEKAVANKKVPK